MIHAQFTDYIVVQDGKVVRYVEARWPATKTHTAGNVTVYRIDDDGKEQVRYLDYRPICGYLVDLDFEDDTWYNISGNCRALRTGANVCSSPLTEKETRGILTVYPEFKWTLQKAGQVNPAKAMKLLIAWKKAHDKVMKEVERIEAAERLARKKEATRREREKKANFEKVVGKWIRKKVRKNGLVVSIPVDIKSVQHQAKVLHQCLVSADYIGKMADRSCLLVFIVTREGAPVATAEILPSGKVGQFYGDERSRESEKMKPGKKAQEALDAWLHKFKPKWRKAA